MAPPVLQAPDVPQTQTWSETAPLPYLEGPTPDGRLITQSDFLDRFLGALAVLVLNLGTPAGLQALLNDAVPSVGSTIVLYALCVTLHLTLFRKRFPAFSKGWKFGLILLAVIAGLSLLAIILLVLGVLAICSGFGKSGLSGGP